MTGHLAGLEPGQVLVFGGDRTVTVPPELAAAFVDGDRLIIVDATGDLLHVPKAAHDAARLAVNGAVSAFAALPSCSDGQISEFFERFADRLADEKVAAALAAANADDIERATAAGRATGRLELSQQMLTGMLDGLRMWAAADGDRDRAERVVDHGDWELEARRAPLGVVGFVFEGRPNVFADAAGVVRTGNTAVLRIGSDALATARAISVEALQPALDEAGLPAGTVTLLDDASRASAWALFSDRRLALGVARGSGSAVIQLGAIGRQSGIAVSLHGTGGAWLVAGRGADAERLSASVIASLDRKVCNTLNVAVVVSDRSELVPVVVAALDAAAARRDAAAVLHVDEAAAAVLPSARAFEPLSRERLGTEWEWDDAPEISLVVVDDLDEAIALYNECSPRFVASIVSDDAEESERFYRAVEAPFVGDGFTRWVDGQYALGTPELGLSNWQFGRLLGRGGVLSGDSVHTVRYRARVRDASLSR